MTTLNTSYQVLARRYRPTKFSELMGQDVLVQTLTNALTSGRIAHAFIFTGVRGVGKTTTARLLARALNCVGHGNNPTADPCGTCPQCVAIHEDRHVDVLEVDAASRTGVDDVRELIDGVHYQPAFGRYKVYIIDEVHMLSKSAFNALLKTLEEPPQHVKFIFATTEIQKLPITVISRCQRFDLKRVGVDVLLPYFSTLLEKETVPFEEDALKLICKAADGSVRDGQSLLEQAIVGRGQDKITETFVKEMLGLGDRSQMVDLLELLFQGNIQKSLEILKEMHLKGISARQILLDLLEIVHALSTMAVLETKDAGLQAIPESSLQKCQEMASNLSIPVLTRTWQVLLKGMEEVTIGVLPECALEMVLIRLTHIKSFLKETKEETPTAPTVAKITQPHSTSLTDFKSIVNLFVEKREVLLADQLKTIPSVEVARPNHLKVHVPHGTKGDFLKDALKFLTTWTGTPWTMDYSEEPLGHSLASQEKMHQAQQHQKALAHPHTQKILETFPEATVKIS
jgi:DNA polymerase-3 subunit gamma/tau